MDEERLQEIEGYAAEARERERKQDYHVRGSTEGKPSPSDDITMLCEDVSYLIAEMRRLRGALVRSRDRYEALEGEGFCMEGVGETAWAMHADAVEALRGE